MKRQIYRNPYQYNYVCSTAPSATFNHQFWNFHQIQSHTLGTGKTTALGKKYQKMKLNLSKISAHSLSDDFDMDSHNFDFDILRKKAKCKRKLTQKLVYWHHIDANPSVIDTIEIL